MRHNTVSTYRRRVLEFARLVFVGIILVLVCVGSALACASNHREILRPLSFGERSLVLDGRINPSDFVFHGRKSVTYPHEEPFIKKVLSDSELVENSLRDIHANADISLNDLVGPPVVCDAGFGNRQQAYHIRFFLTGGRVYDMVLSLYKDIHGFDDRLVTDHQVIGNMQAILHEKGCDDILLRQGRATTIKLEFPLSANSSFSRTKICAFSEYGGLNGSEVATQLLPRLFDQTRALKEDDLYNLMISGLISEEEAARYAAEREALVKLVQERIKMSSADEVVSSVDAAGVTKYFQLFLMTEGRYAISDPRRNNVLFRFDRKDNKWIVRLTDFETAQPLSLADFIVQFDVFNPDYYTGRYGIKYAVGGAGVREWRWTTKPLREKMGFFHAASGGLGGDKAATDMLLEALNKMSSSRESYMYPEAGRCLFMYLEQAGVIAILQFVVDRKKDIVSCI